MYISELLRRGYPTVSCELFPPKKDEGFALARGVVEDTVALAPDFISVTYGAGGGAHKHSLHMSNIIRSLGAVPLAHLTCLCATQREIASLVRQMKREGITNVLALRGDIPAGMPFPSTAHYRHAADLIGELKAQGGFCIGAACYPEGHVESPNQAEDIRYLKAKVDAGCDFLTTQMFFDNNVLYKFLYKIREAGITVPVLAGIMPVTNRAQIRRIIDLSGTSFLPPRFANIVDKFGGDPEAMRQAGIAYATEQIIDLIANDVNGVHIYTMNKPLVAARIMENISCLTGRAL